MKRLVTKYENIVDVDKDTLEELKTLANKHYEENWLISWLYIRISIIAADNKIIKIVSDNNLDLSDIKLNILIKIGDNK